MVVDSLILYVGVQSGSDCASATAVAVTATNVSLSMASSRASRRINLAFVLRSALDEALLEETLRFNLVAARTDFTLAQALSLGLLEVPMVVVFALVYARAASPFALGSGSEQHSAPEHCEEVPGDLRHAIYMVVGCASLALMRAARCPLAYGLCASDCSQSARGSAFRSATRLARAALPQASMRR